MSACSQGRQGLPVKAEAAKAWTGLTADVRATWSAEPGIDLTAGTAVVVRAYVESYFQAKELGDIDVVYPGFTHAVTPNPPGGAPPTGHPWPDTSHPVPHPIQGTDKYHILWIDTNDQRVTAAVCDYSTYTSTFVQPDGTYGYGPGAIDDGVGVLWISMTAPTEPPAQIPPQRGPAPSPTTDVFDNWRITEFLQDIQGDTPRWPTRGADVQRCRDLAPDPLERREFLRKGKHPRSDYPNLPPYPGWPEAGPS